MHSEENLSMIKNLFEQDLVLVNVLIMLRMNKNIIQVIYGTRYCKSMNIVVEIAEMSNENEKMVKKYF